MNNRIIFKPEFPRCYLNDCKISSIEIGHNEVRFVFFDGIYDTSRECIGEDSDRTTKAMVLLALKDLNDVGCTIYTSYTPFHRLFNLAKFITLKELSEILSEGKKIEVVAEYYSADKLLWIGELYPYCKRDQHVVIEACGIQSRTIVFNDKQ